MLDYRTIRNKRQGSQRRKVDNAGAVGLLLFWAMVVFTFLKAVFQAFE